MRDGGEGLAWLRCTDVGDVEADGGTGDWKRRGGGPGNMYTGSAWGTWDIGGDGPGVPSATVWSCEFIEGV